MRKPTHKPQKKKSIPISSLIVDYGRTRKIMPYRVELGYFLTKELADVHAWCTITFEEGAYHQSGVYPGYMYFVKDSDATMFRMRWVC